MPYPDNFSTTRFDAAQGRDDGPEDADEPTLYTAAHGVLAAVDRYNALAFPERLAPFLDDLRVAVAAEKARMDADDAKLRAALERLREIKT